MIFEKLYKYERKKERKSLQHITFHFASIHNISDVSYFHFFKKALSYYSQNHKNKHKNN